MGVTRRTGLMALVGGIFGGPQAAKAAMRGSTKVNLSPYAPASSYDYGEAKQQIQADDPISAIAKRAEHREQLLKQARGEFLPYQKEEIERYNRVENNKIRLKSVSKAYKQIMYSNRAKERAKKFWIEEAKVSLFQMFGIKL